MSDSRIQSSASDGQWGAARPAPAAGIELHIEELILHGFAPGERDGIGVAIQHELARLLGEQGAPPAMTGGGAIDTLDGGTFQMALGAGAAVVGAQVAHNVYQGFSR
jgi:hypothetical protein